MAVYLENDADVAAVGEAACGAACECDPVVMLNIWNGVGGAIIFRQEVYRGAGGEHPELGHMPVSSVGSECYCGIRVALSRSLRAMRSGRPVNVMAGPDARAVFAAASEGDANAKQIVDLAMDAVATAAWTICQTT